MAWEPNENVMELERTLLSKILKQPEFIYQVLGYLKASHFAASQHVEIFEAIEDIVEAGSEPNYLIVSSKLDNDGNLDKAGGKEYLNEIHGLDDITDDLKPIADMIVKAHMVRVANSIGYNMMKLSKSDQDSIESYLSQVNQQIDDLVMGSSGSFTEHIQAIMREEWEELKSRTDDPGITGIKTGLTDYDLMTSGYSPTDLVIIAARPSVGKTTLVVRSILNIAKNNIPVLLFSYEMSRKQLSQRMVSMESGISLQNIRTGSVNENEMNVLKEIYLDVSSYPIYIDSNMSASLGYVLSTIRRFTRTSGVKIVFIDYVQLMVQNSDNETQELGKISRALKMLAMELGITIVIVSQLNRGLEGRDSKRPLLSDLRQSGRLEEDADIVAMLYRPALYGKVTDGQENLLEIIIRKNRNGPVGIVQSYIEPSSVNIFNSLSEMVNAKKTH